MPPRGRKRPNVDDDDLSVAGYVRMSKGKPPLPGKILSFGRSSNSDQVCIILSKNINFLLKNVGTRTKLAVKYLIILTVIVEH